MNKHKYKSNNSKNNNILYRGTERTSIWTILSVSILVRWIKNRFIVIDNEKQMILLLLLFSVVAVLFCCYCSFLLCSAIFYYVLLFFWILTMLKSNGMLKPNVHVTLMFGNEFICCQATHQWLEWTKIFFSATIYTVGLTLLGDWCKITNQPLMSLGRQCFSFFI